ncbi:MAG: ATP-dependent DNA helicase RecG [Bacteroidales bacterium]|nr:ATP-dependent DNA helicase RecG [Bacteroidales bacterium]
MTLDTEISYLKGVGPQRASVLGRELNIFTCADLLNHFPFRYVDRSRISTISSMDIREPYVVLKGVIRNFQIFQTSKFSQRLTARFTDGTGDIELVWFQGTKWVQDYVKPTSEYIILGKPTLYNNDVQIVHPELEPYSGEDGSRHSYMPVYSTTEKLKAKGINSKAISKIVETLLRQPGLVIPETLSLSLIQRFSLMPKAMAMRCIHFPASPTEMQQALLRLKFEELFFMQLDHQYSRISRLRHSLGRTFSNVGNLFNRFYNERLPFEMTGAQKRVIREIWADMRSGRQMNRLLQGDVGSGKTMVALLTMLLAIDNGCQACLMAPTEILAQQHYDNFCRMLNGLDVRVALLIGSLKASQKRSIKQALAGGEIDLLIGTHALIEDSVQFHQLGYVVIDEQHRFGVEQRARLWTKNPIPPHILVMTATPIPRTLAMTLYSDLECSVIDELPPGRQPIKTIHATDSQRLKVFAFLRQQISQGRQVYVVYPLINESEKQDIKDLMDGYESMVRSFPLPEYQISIVHGKLSPEAKAYEMDRFKRGIANIMVSTTVIEVGVDVPNATVMLIENAERFGLSQLHQLRGRVGRGGGASYCILMTKEQLTTTGRQRIETMCATTDGFQIAEADLRLRGPGDIEGREQSGMLNLRLADIVDDEPIVCAARDEVKRMLEADPELQHPDHSVYRQHIIHQKEKLSLSKIS